MNRLINLGFLNLSRQINNKSTRFLSSKKGEDNKSEGNPPKAYDYHKNNRNYDDVASNVDQETQIDLIETNQQIYFGNVKKSFDKLQKNRVNETLEEKRSRLCYQSRKRGTTENGLLLSNFSHKYLNDMSEKELNEYDNIINNLHNEWDLYYWLTSAMPVPDELKDSKILSLMKNYCANDLKQIRIGQPDIVKT